MGPLPVMQPRAGPLAFVASLLTSAGHPASAASEPRVLAGDVFCTLPPASCTLALAPRPPEARFSSLSNPLETPARPTPQLRLSRSSITVVLRERHLESRQAVPSFPFSPSQRSGLLSLPSSVCRCHSVCPCAVCMLYGRMRVGVGRGPGLHLRLTPLTPTLVTPRPSRLWSGHSTPGSLRGAGEHPSSLAQDLRTEVAESPVPGCFNVL